MKKSKLLLKTALVTGLTGVLITASVSSTTFSWFNRPNSLSGKSVYLNVPYGDKDANGSALSMKGYDGSNLTMETFLSTDDAISFSDEAKAPDQSVTGLAPNKRLYYNTVITNKGSTDQRISLYIKNFKPAAVNGTNVCVGVNYPIKAFKNYSLYDQTIPPASKTSASGTVKRVYFEPYGKVPSGNAYDTHRDNWNDGTYYVKSGNNVDSNVESSIKMTRCTSTSTVWYADIPSGHNQLYFSYMPVPENYQRTQTFSNLNGDGLSTSKSLLFYTNGSYTGDYNNAWAGKEDVGGACFGTYYSSISLSIGQTINIALTKNVDYAGGTITYSSSSTSIFTVSTAGVITPKAAGTANLTYTITSDKGDKITKTVKVTVHSYSASSPTITNAPIVTNLLIPANSQESVWWFIQNGDDRYAKSTANASYTHDGIFLGV